MNRDRDRDEDAQMHVVQGCGKGREPLRQVVNADREGCQHASPHEMMARVRRLRLIQSLIVVRVLRLRHEQIDYRDEPDPNEKEQHTQPIAHHLHGLGQQFHERDVDHHACRQAK